LKGLKSFKGPAKAGYPFHSQLKNLKDSKQTASGTPLSPSLETKEILCLFPKTKEILCLSPLGESTRRGIEVGEGWGEVGSRGFLQSFEILKSNFMPFSIYFFLFCINFVKKYL
jgi:hypothetical protein